MLTALTITTVLFSSVFEMVHALLARACRKQMYDNNVRYTMMFRCLVLASEITLFIDKYRRSFLLFPRGSRMQDVVYLTLIFAVFLEKGLGR